MEKIIEKDTFIVTGDREAIKAVAEGCGVSLKAIGSAQLVDNRPRKVIADRAEIEKTEIDFLNEQNKKLRAERDDYKTKYEEAARARAEDLKALGIAKERIQKLESALVEATIR